MNKIKFLESEIIKHKNLYYQGKPEISDFEYDKLEEQLKSLDPKNSILEIVGSTNFKFEKIKHDEKMLSLNKTYKIKELIDWKEDRELISTFKIDGSSCSIIYENGKFVLAKTRGDGKHGENISSKILLIDHIPNKLSTKNKIEVRGEVYCTEENFISISNEMENRDLEKPTSQRNIVAGILGRKENIDLAKFLSFQAFELFNDKSKIKTEREKFQELIKLGFLTPEYLIHKHEKDVEERLDETRTFMSEGNYLIDGLVFTFNDLKVHDELGETAHHPKYKMAFKFQGETKVTTLKNITWQVSRNGILTPVGEVEPVELSGALVSRVTLHNFGMVKQFQLKKGDEIEIVRSGEVIPKFLGVNKASKNKFKIPSRCPSCGEKVREQEIRLICDNKTCPDKVMDEFINFISKIGIDDLSSKRLEEMIKTKIVTDIPSLYKLTKEKLLTLDKTKDKMSEKIIKNIEKTKTVDLVTFLSSLGLTGGAFNKCEKVVNNGFDSIEKVLKLNIEELMTVESFAEKSATEFIKSLKSKEKLIKKLLKVGINITKNEIVKNAILESKKFCITGTLSSPRKSVEKIIKENGGLSVGSVSKNTDYLVTNDVDSSSSKYKKAKQLEIPILTEKMLMEMIGEKK